MIDIECQRENGKISKISVRGHALYDQLGKDIVCAGASAIIFGGLNAIKAIKEFDIKKADALIEIIAHKSASMHDLDVLETMIIQLKTIEESYGKYIKVVEKGC